MTGRTPSRLPTAFVRVSRCPICTYSLKDLAEELPCPECGSPIDRDLITSPEMHDAIATTRAWCSMGALGWIITTYAWWTANTITIPYSGPVALSEHIDDLISSAGILLLAIYLMLWWFKAKRSIYVLAIRKGARRAKTPLRVPIVAIPGMMLGVFGCGLFLLALSAM